LQRNTTDLEPTNQLSFGIKNLCASNHTDRERSDLDYYATEPKAVRLLLEMEKFEGSIWECACGEGHLSEEMKRLGYEVFSSDRISRSYPLKVQDFLCIENRETEHNIITNPPFKLASQFILKGLEVLQEGKKLALLLPVRYLESRARKHIYMEHPPKTVYVSSGRIKTARNGRFGSFSTGTHFYSWIVWQKGYQGETTLKWFN